VIISALAVDGAATSTTAKTATGVATSRNVLAGENLVRKFMPILPLSTQSAISV
jgi:hypothetical protein